MSIRSPHRARRGAARPLRRSAVVSAATALLLSTAGLAHADQVVSDVTVDGTAKVMPLNVGGANGTTTLAVNPTNGDGKNGCNLTGSTVLTVGVHSSNPEVATASPSSITFSACGNTPTITVHPLTAGSTTVSLEQTANTTGGTFDLSTSTFTVNVTASAPDNTAPVVTVGGVKHGGTYPKGTVPDATCDVIDAEDGSSSFAAALSEISGSDAVDGIGAQTATCSYTDSGGLAATSTATYTIVDPTAPTIGYTVDPAAPDGLDGWYRSDAALAWQVADLESPHSLLTTGCADTTVTSDQPATTYTCSATSAGGSAGPVSVTLKRDSTAPVVAYASVVGGTPGTNGWYTSDVTARFTDTDATSGPAVGSKTATSSGEGDNVTVASPSFSDVAGNASAVGAVSSPTFKVDKTAPRDVSFSDGAAGPFYYGSVTTPTCTAIDDVSGLASCVVTADANSGAVGPHQWMATATDVAGNTTPATQNYQVLAWTDKGFYAPVDMGGTVNTVKAGSTVPLKFNVFAGPTELTSTTAVSSFTAKQISCTSLSGSTDAVEVTSTGGTSLRYDSTGHQFIQNWKTPSTAGTCYVVTMTTQDGSTIAANFKLK